MHRRVSRRAVKAGASRPAAAGVSARAGAASWWSRPWVIGLALAVGTVGVYAPVLWCDFVGYDDTVYVTENWHVLQGLNWEQVDWAFANLAAGFWHPLTWLSHMLDAQLYGLHARGHHLTNLLLHAGSTVLLFGLLRRMTGFVWRSAVVAALFAIHPLHVESVAWVAERKDVLSAFFGFVSLWFYVSYARAKSGRRDKAITNYSLALLFFACSLASKATLVTLPLVMLVLDYWPLQRARLGGLLRSSRGDEAPAGSLPGQEVRASLPRLLRGLVLEKAPFLALSVASGLLTIHAEKSIGAVATKGGIPLVMRVSNARGVLCSVSGADGVAGEYGGVLPLPEGAVALAGGGRRLPAGCRDGLGDAGGPPPALSGGGLGLVFGDPAAGERVDSGGVAFPGGPLYLCAAGWRLSHGRVGRRGTFLAQPLAEIAPEASSRRASCSLAAGARRTSCGIGAMPRAFSPTPWR